MRNVPGANAQAVAELALFLMLALARRLPLHRRSFAAGVVGDPPGTELAGKTLGIIGLGASGRKLARMARGIGMDVIALRRNPAPDPDASWVGGPADLHALLGRADYVSLHIPTSAETRGLMNAAALPRDEADGVADQRGARRPRGSRGAGRRARREDDRRRRASTSTGRSRPIPPTRCSRGERRGHARTSAA